MYYNLRKMIIIRNVKNLMIIINDKYRGIVKDKVLQNNKCLALIFCSA